MHNILYISYDGMTDPLGQSQVLPYLIGLSKNGYVIHLISCEKKNKFDKTKSVVEQICKDANINWHPLFYTKTPPILSTIKDIYEINKKAKALHKIYNFSLIHCRSYISSLIGLKFKQKYNVPFLFDMRGFWADERVDGNLWNLKNPIYKVVYNFFKKKEMQFMQFSSAIISLTHVGKKEMLTWDNTIPENKIKIIPCCVDTIHFDNGKINELKKQDLRKTMNTNFLLGYVGSIGTWYLLNEMLLFFKQLLISKPDAKFLFITTDNENEILDMALKLGIDQNKIIIKAVSRLDMPLYISILDWSIFFIKPSYSKKSSSPTKQGEIMAMSIPIICNSIGDTGEIVNKYQSGLVCELNIESFNNTIQLLNDSSFNAAKIREGAKEYFNLQNGIDAYTQIYQTILK